MADHLGQPAGLNRKVAFLYQAKQQHTVELTRLPPRGRHSAVRAGVLVFATYSRGQALSPPGERVALIRMMVSYGRNRGVLP